MKVSANLWGQQVLMSDQMANNEESFILAGCGTGKTLAAYDAIARTGSHRSLVLTIKPALLSVWQDDAHKFTDAEPLVLDEGTAKEKNERLRVASHSHDDLIVIANYETALKLSLNKLHWNMVIADESHRVKAHNSKTSIELAKMVWHADQKVTMTGTAWDDRITDSFGQVRFLAPAWYGKGFGSARLGPWTRFFERYATYYEREHIKIVTGYKNHDELKALLAPIFLYVDRDVWLKSTGVSHITRTVRLSDAHQRAYQELKEELYLELANDSITADSQLVVNTRLAQICGGYYQPDEGGSVKEFPDGAAKLRELVGIAEEVGHEPLVVFTRFTEDINRIRQALTKAGITTSEISGRVDEHRQWQQGRTQCLLANIQAGSAGIDLTRAAFGVLYSTGYSNTDYTQALYRLDRPNQTRPVTIFHILAADTIDEDIYAQMALKSKNRDKLL